MRAAAAVANLLRLDEEETLVSVGLAAAGLGGLLSADELGAGHYLLAGHAATGGAEAAYLARAGARASRTLLDQPAAAAMGASAAPPSPEGQPHLADCVFTAYPCARPLHAALDALNTLADRGLAAPHGPPYGDPSARGAAALRHGGPDARGPHGGRGQRGLRRRRLAPRGRGGRRLLPGHPARGHWRRWSSGTPPHSIPACRTTGAPGCWWISRTDGGSSRRS
ncbi:hypothetical protein ACFYOY_08735 [Streptomyces sp. NPDC007875]|uniref:hypothetical protein n=1 Tax=Streptomyces sp. NPDC007875 TaxID=3364783 RepID=UPI00367529E0